MARRSAVAVALWVTIFAGLAGCGDDGPEMAVVRGTVRYDGQPLAQARIVFSPDSGDRVASATTNDEGEYKLGTFVPADGAIVGRYRVTITARGPRKTPAGRLPPGLRAADIPPGGLPGLPTVPGDPLIPAKYFDAGTSGLEAEVRSGTTNVFDFALAKE